jgi:hypothetical protein
MNPLKLIQEILGWATDWIGYAFCEFAFGIWGDGSTPWSAPLHNKRLKEDGFWDQVAARCYSTGVWFYNASTSK